MTAAEGRATALDADDPAPGRDAVLLPPWPGGAEPALAYLAGNSLGLQPRSAAAAVGAALERWAAVAVEGWFDEPRPWVGSQAAIAASIGRLAGCGEHETVAMNALTVNLHLLLASFYRPVGDRTRILIEAAPFPSDDYAIASHVAVRGLDPAVEIVRLRPRAGEVALRTDDVLAAIARGGERLALVLLAGVDYLSGAVLDMGAAAAAARTAGAVCGLDLAHAIGNVPLALHDWGADFAVWCTYKYLGSGPGGVGGAFVHERHHGDPTLPRLAGWWGNDPATRFEMRPRFAPAAGATGWSVSTPPVLSLAALEASLELFDAIGMEVLRARSLRLTGYLLELVEDLAVPLGAELLTPPEPERRGAQLSLAVPADANVVCARLRAAGVIADARRPNVVRLAPVPLSSSYRDAWRGATALARVLG